MKTGIIKDKVKELMDVFVNIFTIISAISLAFSGIGAFFVFSSEKFKIFITSNMNIDDTAFNLLNWLLVVLIVFVLTTIILSIFLIRLKLKKYLYIQPSTDNKRIYAIKKLDNNANKTIYIMGIGLSNVTSTLDDIEKALEIKDMHIIILTIDSKITYEANTYLVPSIGGNIIFSEYIYKTYNVKLPFDHNNQINRIENFINGRKDKRRGLATDGASLNGKIELRKYSSFLPMNITIADKDDENSMVIIEYIIPFDAEGNRIRLEINKRDYNSGELKKVAANAKEIIEKLMAESNNHPIIADYDLEK